MVVAGALLLVLAATAVYFIENPPGGEPEEISEDDIAQLKADAVRAERERTRAEWRNMRRAGLGGAIPFPAGKNTPEDWQAAVEALRQRDAKLRSIVIGNWDLPKQRKGDYRLELKDDKSGVLTFTPNYKYRVPLFLWRGSLKFNLQWKVKDGHIDMWSVSGSPKRSFDIAIKHEGRRMYFHVEKSTPKRLVLKNVKDGKVDDWKRIH